MIEEDILFPCPDTPITRTPRASPTLRGRLSRIHSQTQRDTVFSDDEESIQDYYEDFFETQKSRSVDTISGEQDQVKHLKFIHFSPLQYTDVTNSIHFFLFSASE